MDDIALDELAKCVSVLERIAKGDVDARIEGKIKSKEVAPLANEINRVADELRELIKEMHEMAIGMTMQFDVMHRLIRGDVEARLKGTPTGNDLIDKMGEYIDKFGDIYKESVDQSMELSLAIAQFLSVLKEVREGNLKVRAPIDFELDAIAALGKGINQAIEKVAERAALEDLLKELSTPVLYAWEGIIVMPLIGTLTSDRAQDAMERLLNSITNYRAKFAIIDITGVPVIDTMVAQHLIKTVKAVKILGSEAVITGISAEVASILVKIGIEVEQFITRNTLREGLQHAIRMIKEDT